MLVPVPVKSIKIIYNYDDKEGEKVCQKIRNVLRAKQWLIIK